jgi:hypothetical protein
MDKDISEDLNKAKIRLDNMTYYQKLAKKTILNKELYKVVFQNFYRDEFNRSRLSSYILGSFPLSVFLFYGYFKPQHPLQMITTGIILLSSFGNFVFYLNKDMEDLMKGNSNLGKKLYSITNEISLYNPLVKNIKPET